MQAIAFVGGLVLLIAGVVMFGAGLILNPRVFHVWRLRLPGAVLFTLGGLLLTWSQHL